MTEEEREKPDATQALIEMCNATVWRGSTCVFRELTLTIPQHQSLAIIGPNGSGKTTLAKVLARELYPVLRPDTFVRLLGRERFSIWDYRRAVGIVAEDVFRHFPSKTTVYAAVISALSQTAGLRSVKHRFTKIDKQSTSEILQQLGIEHLAHRTIDSLSTGQLRRTMLGRALAGKPRILILDEPSTGLDLAIAFEQQNTIRRLVTSGANVLLITHNISEIPPEIERIIALKDGQIYLDGRKEDVLSDASFSALYDTPIRVIESDGHYVALPAST